MFLAKWKKLIENQTALKDSGLALCNVVVSVIGPPRYLGEQENKVWRGTKTISGNREQKKTLFFILRNRGTNQFVSGKQWNRYPLGTWVSLEVFYIHLILFSCQTGESEPIFGGNWSDTWVFWEAT